MTRHESDVHPVTDLTPQEREAMDRSWSFVLPPGLEGREIWDDGWKQAKKFYGADRDRLAARVAQREKERDEAERKAGEVARRVAELEAHPVNLEPGRRTELERRLQQATEALRENRDAVEYARDQALSGRTVWLDDDPIIKALESARLALAALAGEDDGPPKPQREGDYL